LKKEDAKLAILAEWDRWAPDQGLPSTRDLPSKKRATGGAALKFFRHLQDERSDLLNFQSSEETWQVVHGFLRSAGVAD
jgi:hypothetical protein